uniref:3CxxC-type domain-containing protein n=1 Tax=Monopterus albus TaxID=43700 RepID=A0A3Q3JKV8_MONAL
LNVWCPKLWQEIFDELLYNELDYEDQWTLHFDYNLTNEVTKEKRKTGWKVHSHCARGGFQCNTCSRRWSSVKVTVLFHYRLKKDQGTVIMRPFGQSCHRCSNEYNNKYYRPGFFEVEVKRALLRLFAKIRKNCYGEQDDYDDKSEVRNKVLTKPHEAGLCEACQLGICCKDVE